MGHVHQMTESDVLDRYISTSCSAEGLQHTGGLKLGEENLFSSDRGQQHCKMDF